MTLRILICSALLTFVNVATTTNSASAQSSNGLVKALSMTDEYAVNGSVSISEEKAEGNGLGGMIRVAQVEMMGAGKGEAVATQFTGELEVHVAGGSVSAATSSGLPQIKIFKKGKKQLVNHTYSKSRTDVEAAANSLSQLLDFKGLVNEVKDAKRVRVKEVDGGTQYRVTIDADYFESSGDAGGPLGMATNFSEQVLEGVLRATTGSDGVLQSMELEIQYNDPMAGVLEKALQGGLGGSIELEMELGDFEKSDKLGRKVVLAFKASDTESKNAKAFAQEAAELLNLK